MSSRGRRSKRWRRQLGQKKPRQAIVGGEKKNEVAWSILDVVGMMKAGVDKLVALVCFLGGSRSISREAVKRRSSPDLV